MSWEGGRSTAVPLEFALWLPAWTSPGLAATKSRPCLTKLGLSCITWPSQGRECYVGMPCALSGPRGGRAEGRPKGRRRHLERKVRDRGGGGGVHGLRLVLLLCVVRGSEARGSRRLLRVAQQVQDADDGEDENTDACDAPVGGAEGEDADKAVEAALAARLRQQVKVHVYALLESAYDGPALQLRRHNEEPEETRWHMQARARDGSNAAGMTAQRRRRTCCRSR